VLAPLPPEPLLEVLPALPEPLLEVLAPVPDVVLELPSLVVLAELELLVLPVEALPVVPALVELPEVLPVDVLLVDVVVDVLTGDGGVNCKFHSVPFQVECTPMRNRTC